LTVHPRGEKLPLLVRETGSARSPTQQCSRRK
jgi:hypothetical protein